MDGKEFEKLCEVSFKFHEEDGNEVNYYDVEELSFTPLVSYNRSKNTACFLTEVQAEKEAIFKCMADIQTTPEEELRRCMEHAKKEGKKFLED